MPSSVFAPMPALGEATVPLTSFIRPYHRHYFSGRSERSNYRLRRYDFAGTPILMPLVRAFLDTCAADRSTDYRYLFTLLGSELANNAIRHSLSGHPGGGYTLCVQRRREGLSLVCKDRGRHSGENTRLAPRVNGLDPQAESGRGLAMVDALATDWGDNGRAEFRSVWFSLDYDLTGSRWNADD
jgi:hypothetical protein